MFFNKLITAIEKLADSMLVLAQAVRYDAGDHLDYSGEEGFYSPEYSEEELLDKIKARIDRLKERELDESPPTAEVFYASEEAASREATKEEIEDYLKSRGYGPEAREEAQEVLGISDNPQRMR